MTPQPIVVRRYGPAALQTLTRIREVALLATRAVAGGDRIVLLSVAAPALVAGPLRLVAELNDRPSAPHHTHILGAADQITAALLAMVLHEQGVPAVSLTWEQAGLTRRTVAEGARSGDLSCDRVRVAIARYPVVVLASACGTTDDGDTCTLDDTDVELAVIALVRALGARGAHETFEIPATNRLLASTA